MVKQIHAFFLIFSLLLIISGCQSTAPQPDSATDSTAQSQLSAAQIRLNQIEQLIITGDLTSAELQIQQLSMQSLTLDEQCLLYLSQAQLAARQGQSTSAIQLLNSSELQAQLPLAHIETQLKIGLYQAELLEAEGYFFSGAKLRSYLAPMITEQARYVANHYAIWHDLGQLTADDLHSQIDANDKGIFQQWLPLSLMLQHTDKPLNLQIAHLERWQQQHPTHPAALIPLPEMAAIRSAASQRPAHIAVLLPFDGKYRKVGEAIRDGLLFSYFQTEYQPHISFYAVDSSLNFVDSYHDAIADGAELVIGPLFKEQLQELYTLDSLPVPTIALNKLDQADKPANLIEFGMAQDDEISSLIKLAQQYHHHSAAVISQQASWAEKASTEFIDQWLASGNNIAANITFTSTKQQSQAIQELLNIDKSKQRIRELRWLTGANIHSEPRRRQDIDMITILAKPEPAATIRPLLAFHYASDIPVFATSSVYRGFNNPKKDNDLNGIKITDIPLLITQTERISDKYQQSPLIRMYAFGMDAFQLAERYKLLEALPQQKIYGATGELSISGQSISRETAFAEFRRGKIRPIAKLTQAADNLTPPHTTATP